MASQRVARFCRLFHICATDYSFRTICRIALAASSSQQSHPPITPCPAFPVFSKPPGGASVRVPVKAYAPITPCIPIPTCVPVRPYVQITPCATAAPGAPDVVGALPPWFRCSDFSVDHWLCLRTCESLAPPLRIPVAELTLSWCVPVDLLAVTLVCWLSM